MTTMVLNNISVIRLLDGMYIDLFTKKATRLIYVNVHIMYMMRIKYYPKRRAY